MTAQVLSMLILNESNHSMLFWATNRSNFCSQLWHEYTASEQKHETLVAGRQIQIHYCIILPAAATAILLQIRH